MAAQERIVANVVVPLDYTYNYRVGSYLERRQDRDEGKGGLGG